MIDLHSEIDFKAAESKRQPMMNFWIFHMPSLWPISLMFWIAGLSTAAKWAYGSTFLVFVGVVIETIADLTSWIKPDDLKKIVEKVGALILILGLAADLVSVGMSQIEAGNLNAIAESARERTGQLEKETTQLQREAAQLKKDAESERLARVKIEDAVAWRSISTDEQVKKLKSTLGAFSPQRVMVLHDVQDIEADQFALDIGKALHKFGWSAFESPNTFSVSVGGTPIDSVPPLKRGVEIISTSDKPSSDAAKALISELMALGFDAAPSPLLPPPGAQMVWVQVHHRPEGAQGEAKLREEAEKKAKAKTNQNTN